MGCYEWKRKSKRKRNVINQMRVGYKEDDKGKDITNGRKSKKKITEKIT